MLYGAMIDILVQPKRDRFAAIRFFRKLLRTSWRHPRESSQTNFAAMGLPRKFFYRVWLSTEPIT